MDKFRTFKMLFLVTTNVGLLLRTFTEILTEVTLTILLEANCRSFKILRP